MMRAAIYARVSTHDQNAEMQLAELREYCGKREWKISEEYVDRGVSGAKERRPALDRLLRACTRRETDVVVVWKLDRLGRSLRHLVNLLAEWESQDITFVSLRDALDLSTPAGKLMFNVIGAMAQFERDLIAERVKAGMRRAMLDGKHVGRNARTDVDPAKVASLREQGKSWGAIAREMNAGIGTVHRAYQRASKRVSESTSVSA